MARVDVVMPQMGESIAEGTLSRWLKKVGDEVKRDEPIFEISTDKVDAEIPSPSNGVLAEILVTEGQTVPVQTVVARLETEKGAAIGGSGAPAPAASAAPREACAGASDGYGRVECARDGWRPPGPPPFHKIRLAYRHRRILPLRHEPRRRSLTEASPSRTVSAPNPRHSFERSPPSMASS